MASVRRCCITNKRHQACNVPVPDWLDYPVCMNHAARIASALRLGVTSHLASQHSVDETEDARVRALQRESAERLRRKSRVDYVYYVRHGDQVKIGHAVDVEKRMGSLALSVDDIMALEPGGVKREHAMHRKFDEVRVRKDREWFYLSEELLMHIESVQRKYPELIERRNLTVKPKSAKM